MLALVSSPLRRWLLVSLLLPVIAFALSKIGRTATPQRRRTHQSFPGATVDPTFTRRHSGGRREVSEPEPTPSSPAAAQPISRVRS